MPGRGFLLLAIVCGCLVLEQRAVYGATGHVEPGDVVRAAESLAVRVLGKEAGEKLTFCFLPISNDQHDTFEVNIPSPGKVWVCGNSGVAIARGLYHYLRVVCNSSMTWGRRGSGDNINVPIPLPGSKGFYVRKSSSVKWRYYMNVCTVSYSSVWWDWQRWEREIDWMALHGINFPLAFTGQEHVLAQFFTQLGLTPDEQQDYFTGPAFLAWNRMGNLRKWGGPLLPNFRESQFSLQLLILKRMRALGMTPILPGFSGHIPAAIKRIYPHIQTRSSSGWVGFNSTYTGVHIIDATDPYFLPLAKQYYELQTKMMGTDHVYNVDNFNEMSPPTHNPEFLSNASAAVYNGMKAADPQAVWVMQGWLFVNSGFWTEAAVQAYLSPVPDSQMIILDLYAEVVPLWLNLGSFYGKSFIWCMLHNFGGRRDLNGNLSHIAHAPHDALNTPGSSMVGIGLTPEAIEQNPVMYELMLDTAWHNSPIDVQAWLDGYVGNRYRHAGHLPQVKRAWRLLESSVYSLYWPYRFLGVMHLYPSLGPHGLTMDQDQKAMLHYGGHPSVPPDNQSLYNCSAVTAAWREMISAGLFVSAQSNSMPTGPFSYDLVDIGRQVLVDVHADMVTLIDSAYKRWLQTGANTSQEISVLFRPMLDILADLDHLLANDQNFLLGKWVEDAYSMGATDEERAILMMNAKNQVTLWGPHGEITDYAEKHWAGLVKTYYRARWETWAHTVFNAVHTNTPPDLQAYYDRQMKFEEQWYQSSQHYSTEPGGEDVVAISEHYMNTWARKPTEAEYKIVLHGQTITGHSLHAAPLKSHGDLEQMMLLCYYDTACLGFTTDGYLKSNVSYPTAKAGVDLYVLTSRL
ncbi:alpha-N-acetylglucosaminidase-like [Sycon ciliatum]|uniref:alpha-N-acetylglucosaminidase-like n=1 Tax=Sycon ciliatum TaxID=27933 RepID=UPI0031F6BF7F|eukprot:scpid53455/ scgid23906/ Alpha-N-acetylglucosaminidase; N-acetyl-alpha-glucosaminidase; Alpha-N-acetylglucosaminidase 82 kDa form; Alpha-N-acetylglucosaminidase 77 kDa form